MWNALQVLYEEIVDVKDSKINMLIYEFDLFCIEPREFVESMQTHFLHLINKLYNLGKFVSNKDCANKILRFMCRERQLKVTSIKEYNNLNTLDM